MSRLKAAARLYPRQIVWFHARHALSLPGASIPVSYSPAKPERVGRA